MNDINIFYKEEPHPIIEKNLKSLCSKILDYKRYKQYDVSIIFISDDELKDMKKKIF